MASSVMNNLNRPNSNQQQQQQQQPQWNTTLKVRAIYRKLNNCPKNRQSPLNIVCIYIIYIYPYSMNVYMCAHENVCRLFACVWVLFSSFNAYVSSWVWTSNILSNIHIFYRVLVNSLEWSNEKKRLPRKKITVRKKNTTNCQQKKTNDVKKFSYASIFVCIWEKRECLNYNAIFNPL